LRVPHLERLDTDALRRYADPRVAGAHPIVVRLEPIDIEIVPRRHVDPLDDDRAVELPGCRRPAHDDTRLVGMPTIDDRAGRHGWSRVAIRRTLEKKFFFNVRVLREIVDRG